MKKQCPKCKSYEIWTCKCSAQDWSCRSCKISWHFCPVTKRNRIKDNINISGGYIYCQPCEEIQLKIKKERSKDISENTAKNRFKRIK